MRNSLNLLLIKLKMTGNENLSQDMRNSFNLLLIVLAWFDIFFIIIAVLDYSVARGDHFDVFILTTRKESHKRFVY